MSIDSSTISDYLSNARQLRASMRANHDDYLFAWEGRIVYFVDANIANLFASPKNNQRHLDLFENWLDPSLLLSSTILAAEFIFSRNLPGQRGEPAYITPDHYDDLQNMAGGIVRKGTETITRRSTPPEAVKQQEIFGLIEKYKKKKIEAASLLSELGKLLPGAIMNMLVGPLTEARQLRRLIADDSLVRADREKWFHGDLLEPNADLVADWVVRIQQNLSPNRSDRSAANLFRDARSIVQLMTLSAEADADVRYVFITTDAAIRRAYRDYPHGQKPAKRIHFRGPREFAPLLNLASMSGHKEMEQLFPRIQEALEDLLAGFSAHDSPNEFSNNAEIKSQIDQLKSWWRQAATTALTINSQYLVKREEVNLEAIARVLSEEDIIKAAVSQLTETIEKVSDVHIRLAIGGIVARFLAKVQNRLNEDPAFLARRAPLQFKTDHLFEKFIGRTPTNKYLDELYKGRAKPPAPDALAESGDAGLSFLFATCVALTAEDWHSASSLSAHALTLLADSKSAEVLDEARYCRAVSLRFVMRSKEEFDEALELIEKCLNYAEQTRSHFGRFRGKAELGAIYYVLFFRARLGKGSKQHNFEPLDFDVRWRRCWQILDEASGMRDEIGVDPSWEKRRLYLRTALQVYAVRAALAIYEHWFAQVATQYDDQLARQESDLNTLKQLIDEWNAGAHAPDAPYTAQVFVKVLEYILAGDSTLSAARSDAERLLDGLLKFKDDLSEFDRGQFTCFRNRIKAYSYGA